MKNLLEQLLFLTNAQKVLHYFLGHPTGRFYDREVSKQTGISRAGTNFALRDLAKAGLLQREKKGRMSFYSIRENDPLIRQLKVVRNVIQLKPLLQDIGDHVLRVIIYGSAAKGENTEDSDIDLFILTRNKAEVEKRVYNHMAKIKLQPVIHTPQEWAKIEGQNQVFASQVEQGIVLWTKHEP